MLQLLAQLAGILGVEDHAYSSRKSASAVFYYVAPAVGFAGDPSHP